MVSVSAVASRSKLDKAIGLASLPLERPLQVRAPAAVRAPARWAERFDAARGAPKLGRAYIEDISSIRHSKAGPFSATPI